METCHGKRASKKRSLLPQQKCFPEAGSRTRTLIEEAFGERGLRLRVTMQLPGTEAVKKAVEANLAVAMVSRYSVSRELSLDALARVPVDGLVLERPIHILHRKGKHLSPLARRFLTFASEYVAESEGTLKRIRK